MADWTDPRIPAADVCVLRDVLDRQARERPAQVAVVFPGGTEWTYAELNAHPDVQECAVIPVPAAVSEDEVLVVVAPRPGCRIDPAALLEFLRPRMAHFMLPRYIRVIDELPKTPTAKVQKAELRREALTPDTWDREVAGISIRAERLG